MNWDGSIPTTDVRELMIGCVQVVSCTLRMAPRKPAQKQDVEVEAPNWGRSLFEPERDHGEDAGGEGAGDCFTQEDDGGDEDDEEDEEGRMDVDGEAVDDDEEEEEVAMWVRVTTSLRMVIRPRLRWHTAILLCACD